MEDAELAEHERLRREGKPVPRAQSRRFCNNADGSWQWKVGAEVEGSWEREEEQLQEVPGWDRQLGMLRTLTQLDETAMDGASAGSDASCSAIPAQSIVQEERKKKRKHLKHKRASEQDAGSLRALEQLSVGSMKKKKQQKKTKKKRGAALLNVTEH
jgi:hypothetical protein